MIKVSVIEDDKNYRAGLEKLINRSGDFQILKSYVSAEEAIADILHHTPEIAIVDIKLPGINGIEFISTVKKEIPDTLFLICSYYDSDDFVFSALKKGASGYILKDADPKEILESLRDLIAGGSPMNKFIARKVISAFQETPVVHTLSELSERENEILQLLATGLLVKEVSEKLCLSAHTIKSHMRNIYTKLHVNNRVEAINKLNNQK